MKKMTLIVVGLLAVAGVTFAATKYVSSVRVFSANRSVSTEVVRYYDEEADMYIYASAGGGLQVVKGKSWEAR